MNDDKPSLSEAIRLLAERDRRSLGAHPKIEELAAYHAGELEPQAVARVREHISVCRECSDLLLDLINFADLTPPPGEPDLTDDEMEQDWQALRARMGEGNTEEPARPKEVVPIRSAATAPAPGLSRTSPWLPVAASLLAVLGLSFGLYQSYKANEYAQRLKTLQEPRVVEAVNAHKNDAVRGNAGAETESPASLSSEQGGVVFLFPDLEKESLKYQIEILRDGKVRWSGTATTQESQPLEEISIEIPGGFLEPGSYKLRLLRGDGTLDHDAPLEVDD